MDLACTNAYFVNNPNKLPLSKLYLQYENITRNNKVELNVSDMLKRIEKPPDKYGSHYSVKSEKKPAIDKCWINLNHTYVYFQPYHVQFDESENSQFLERNRDYLKCIEFFAACTFQQFWCYVSCEPRFARVVINFLENAVSPCAVKYLSSKPLSLYTEIYNCIYKIYKRLINFSVSEIEFIEEDVAIKYLHKSNLIEPRVIMNVCYLFVHTQEDFVRTLINLYCTSQVKDVYTSELQTFWDEIFDDFDNFCARSQLSVFNPSYIEETSCYLYEAAKSLQTFTTLCEAALSVALEQQFVHKLPHIYQKVYVDLYDMCDMRGDRPCDSPKLEELISQWLALGRECFVELFHNFISYCLNQILENQNEQRKQEEYFEIYLALISTALDDDFFIRDYNQIHSVKDQFELLADTIPNFDKSQTEYLLRSLPAIVEATPLPSSIPNEDVSSQQQFPQALYKSMYATLSRAVPGANQPETVTDAIKNYEQLMRQWELNPNCWTFDEICDAPEKEIYEEWQDLNKPSDKKILQRIAAVKEMLPDLNDDYILQRLKCVDYKPELVISHILDEENRASESARMVSHIGKKPQHSDAKDLLDDRNEDIKNLVLKASHNYEDDDDYDDRNEIYNNFEPDNNDTKLYRHLKQNNVEYDAISDPSSSDDEAGASAIVKPSDAFCEDPEVVRARRAAQRGRIVKSSRTKDVVGRPKGQGQDNAVKQDREKKNVHKSQRANHNRKGGAQWKRSRGMMPS